jgi:hypothetical protein
LYDGIFFRVLDEIKETYENTDKTPAILEILNKLGPLGEAKKADMILEEEENKKRQEKWEKERQTKTDGNDSDDVEPIPVPKKRTIVKKVIKKKTQV